MNNYLQAARLRTLPLSLSGIIVGSAMAASDGFFDWQVFVLALLTTVGFQVVSNFANDYGDGIKGTDNHERIGPKRALQSGAVSPRQMRRVIIVSVLVTFGLALLLIYKAFGAGDWLNLLVFLVLGIACLIAAITYTVGKKAYGYHGFGDLFVLLFFGLVSVLGSYYLFAKELSFSICFPALSVGALSMGVLNLNNMRDQQSDARAGKNTLVVKMGAEMARYYHIYLLVVALLCALLYNMISYRSPFQFLFLMAFLPIAAHGKFVLSNKEPALLDPELKKLAMSTFLFSLLFALGNILI